MHRYSNRKYIGSGATGYTYSALDNETKKMVALKIVNPANVDGFKREVKNLSQLKHRNIVQMLNRTGSKSISKVIVLEKMDCDLFTFLSRHEIDDEQALGIFVAVCKAIQHCHAHKIAHLDIKPENILLSNYGKCVKLCDFGGSAQWSTEVPLVCETSSTLEYSAPEVLVAEQFAGDKADMWSLGILLHILYTGNWPFDGKDEEEAMKNLQLGRTKISETVPPNVASLIKKLLSLNPSNRPYANETVLYVASLQNVVRKQRLLEVLPCGC
eukprot:CAMPEP_0206186950 /NCGR_PEP_ID=MMETSP0166-20121206/2707_1 /ASSEMBLY_ACC=CAM_ASM_000260 /TAXON_ID=95228 /ORGANISM="Vannella robusta, Strain DIVA3 518/3/11/1/6" /LENGTH=269 /DNA_ID=CAMNT_0053602431 /DNA_START=33 /DNA_END=839 /DNA_ORIENTATION=-